MSKVYTKTPEHLDRAELQTALEKEGYSSLESAASGNNWFKTLPRFILIDTTSKILHGYHNMRGSYSGIYAEMEFSDICPSYEEAADSKEELPNEFYLQAYQDGETLKSNLTALGFPIAEGESLETFLSGGFIHISMRPRALLNWEVPSQGDLYFGGDLGLRRVSWELFVDQAQKTSTGTVVDYSLIEDLPELTPAEIQSEEDHQREKEFFFTKAKTVSF